jgi:hypothetical protein
MDSNPFSVPATRNAYESRANVGALHPGYSRGIDASHALGSIHWLFSDGIVSGYVVEDMIAEFEVASLEFQGVFSIVYGTVFYGADSGFTMTSSARMVSMLQ